jgi:LmbE family N-acetylglucosaminyl deacetylase
MSPAELGTILGVWAHPDDEAYLAGGVMAAARQAGSRVAVLTATLGEQGTPDPVALPPERLRDIREAELQQSLGVLGVVEHRVLGYADGACDLVPVEEGARRVAAAIEAVEPDTILTFGPDGYTGHPDHRSMSTWVDRAAVLTRSRARVLHATTDPAFIAAFADVHDGFDVFFAGRPSITDIDRLAIHHRLEGSALDQKIEALLAQRSQTAGIVDALGIQRYREWVAAERFVGAGVLAAA